MGHRVHKGRTVRDTDGSPVLIGPPLLTEDEFHALQDTLGARSNGIHPKRRETSLLIGVAHCAGCGGRMYFAARKTHSYGDYVCRAPAVGTTCSAPAGIRADWLDDYTVSRYQEAFVTDAEVTREQLLRDGVRVTVTKGRSGGGPDPTPPVSHSRPDHGPDLLHDMCGGVPNVDVDTPPRPCHTLKTTVTGA